MGCDVHGECDKEFSLDKTRRKARREYICAECKALIPKRGVHWVWSGVIWHTWWHARVCDQCEEDRTTLHDAILYEEVGGYCNCIGGLSEVISEAFLDGCIDAAVEERILYPGHPFMTRWFPNYFKEEEIAAGEDPNQIRFDL